jgi:hypothetical protein
LPINTNTGISGGWSSTCKWIPGTDICYLAGEEGSNDVIAKSTDGGLTWANMNTSGVIGITHMDFYTDGDYITGYAVTNTGRVLKLYEPVSQDTLYVPGDYPTIQAAIDSANHGDVVLVDEDTYYENINFKGKAITVASHFLIDGDSTHIDNTIIDGSQPTHPDSGSVVYFVSAEDTNSVLCGFTITGGSGTYSSQYTSRDGGGIFCENSGGKIINNVIKNNSVSGVNAAGGGIFGYLLQPESVYLILKENKIINNIVTASTGFAGGGGVEIYEIDVKIVNNNISNNSVYSGSDQASGGGIICYSELANLREVIIKDNTITRNYVSSDASLTNLIESYGGGIYIRRYLATVQHNVITHNTLSASVGTGGGGGIWIRQVTVETIIDCNLIAYNTIEEGIGFGGGLAMNEADPKITNNIITQNNATNGGAFGLAVSSSPKIINNTITSNEATSLGGGIYSSTSNPIVMNTILWGNTAPTGPQISGSATVVFSDVEGGWAGEGNIDVNPSFSDTLFHLADSSLCIGAGIDSIDIGGTMYYCPLFCYHGSPRPNPPGSMPDIGACESPRATPVGVEDDLSQIPEEYSLGQNYPNPFNPTTTIKYQIPEVSFITLKVYDVLGNEIAILVNEERPIGNYEIEFDASYLASGIYFYRIQAGNYVETKKMILLK